tara:strand:- start:528 stop:776 length:249 start_codon:yes stop_codon:yes gene_type:complete
MEMNNMNETNVEFRLVHDDELPPIVITMNDVDDVKCVINANHQIWLMLHRKKIAGSAEALFGKIDDMLTAFLAEQRNNEVME